jgi:hypothetical protein
MTKRTKQIAAVVVVALVLWWLFRSPAVGKKVSEYIIDDDVNSPTFGLPVYGPPAPAAPAASAKVSALTNEAADKIAAFNADHPDSVGGDYGRLMGGDGVSYTDPSDYN